MSNTPPVLSVEGMEGPLDWLLEMATAQKIDLARLSILALIEAFSTALEAALDRSGRGASVQLGQWGNWLVMAATLAWLRSRLMLPPDAPEARAAVNEAEALRRLWLRRIQIGEAADWLGRQPQLGRDVFVRAGSEAPARNGTGDITELLRACLTALRLAQPAEAYRPRPAPFWRVGDALARFGELLPQLPPGSPMSAYVPPIGQAEPDRARRCRVAVASTLLASLELARNGVLKLEQPAMAAPIQVWL
jgi:segregation and condensation protein A